MGRRLAVDGVKERLESELSRVAERIRRMGSDIGPMQSPKVIWHGGIDDSEAGCLGEDREMSFASRSLVIEKMRRLAEALEHVEHGNYGTCRECGGSIAPARLRVMPEVTTCIRCQERLERRAVLAGSRQRPQHRRGGGTDGLDGWTEEVERI